jgi:hypothetical protein
MLLKCIFVTNGSLDVMSSKQWTGAVREHGSGLSAVNTEMQVFAGSHASKNVAQGNKG